MLDVFRFQTNKGVGQLNFKSECEMFEYLEKNCYTDAFSDILDEMDFRFQVIPPSANIRPLKQDHVVMGRACTMLNVRDSNQENPYELVIECIEQLKPSSILVTTGKEKFEEGIMGELSATALKAVGCRGAVVNGYTRDIRKLILMDFPTFAWGPSPIDTTGRLRVTEYNIPITIKGIPVRPSDILFCDLDGIVVVPKEVESDVIGKVLERIQEENLVRQELAEGRKISKVWDKYHIL